MLADPAFAPWRAEALKRGYASSIALPLLAGGQTLGALTIYSREPDPFSDDEVQLLTELAGDLACGIQVIRSQQQLAEQARELARSNAELEQFASVVSHDLRGPMTSLSGCSQLLLELYGHTLDEEGRELLGAVRDSVHDMARLIDSLLRYSRVGRGQLKRTPCDLNAVLAGVLRDDRAVVRTAGAEVTQDPLPVVMAEPALLAQLLQNLVENAIKYRGEAPPRVHVSARETPGEWVISIADNGIGIDPKHFERIFQVFQRLHTDESKYPGLGLGLATCKKIVQRHGGRIWLESEPGRGSTFYFALPR
jgi:light-regulated signal transduction histidine kinase (bacteriophytochrome)